MNINDDDELARCLAIDPKCWRRAAVKKRFDSLKNERAFKQLMNLAEKAARFHSMDPQLRRLQAQALIESDQPATAVDVIERICSVLSPDHPEFAELQGLLGRAYKQMFIESGGKVGSKAMAGEIALFTKSYAAYETCYRRDTDSFWHGINLLALKALAQRRGLRARTAHTSVGLANQVIGAAKPVAAKGDPWAQATLVEAYIALRKLTCTERELKRFLNNQEVTAFHVGSLLRQLVQVWQLDQWGGKWIGVLATVRATHARMPGADPTLQAVREVKQQQSKIQSMEIQFQRILGKSGPVTWKWWNDALQRAMGVAAVRDGSGSNIGTAFAVRGEDLVDKWRGRVLLLTNYHVVNRNGLDRGLRPDEAELVFEAINASNSYRIKQVLWESPPHAFDCSVLLLDGELPKAVAPLPFASTLPRVDSSALVYVVGHPAGRGLEFSINDNDLIDHLNAPDQVTRVHYRTPTEPGSSGSPVLNRSGLQVLAIHHAYTRSSLSGKTPNYQANEGIGLQSIRKALAAIAAQLPTIP